MSYKLLDSTGLTQLWNKIKLSFVRNDGPSTIEVDSDSTGLEVENFGSASTMLTAEGLVSYKDTDGKSNIVAFLQYGSLQIKHISVFGGSSSQVLIADGSIKTINAANGICGLDANGRIPLAQLGIAIVDNSQNSMIPFVANHQIVTMNKSADINVYDWFQGASKGGILEVFSTGAQGGYTYCTYNNNVSIMYKMQITSHGPFLNRIDYLKTSYDTYARLIKMDDNKLVVAEFVQNN